MASRAAIASSRVSGIVYDDERAPAAALNGLRSSASLSRSGAPPMNSLA